MKNILIAGFLSLICCEAVSQDKKVVVNDNNAQPRNISASFDVISVSGSIDLYLSQSDEEVVVVSAAEAKYRDRIITEVVDGILKIYYNDKGLQWSSGSRKLKAYISFKDIKKITASGASDINVNGIIKSEVLKIYINGSSDFNGVVDVNKLYIDQSGSSDSRIRGRAATLKIDVSGASDLKGYELVADYCEAIASGASHIQVTVNKELSAIASGASDISYKGGAVAHVIKSSGASSIKKKD